MTDFDKKISLLFQKLYSFLKLWLEFFRHTV